MDKENYVKGCSMQRTPLLEAEGFCFWKTRFETYVKSKDIDLWQVIQNDFVFIMDDPETKMEVETPYEFLKDDEKKQLGKNNEAKITFYNALPRKEYEESSCVKPPRRAKVVVIKEVKDLATLPLDEVISNLKFRKLIFENDGVASKSTKNVKSLALIAKVIMEQTSDDSYSQRGSDEDVDKEEVKPFNFIAKNFCKQERSLISECQKPKENKDFVRGAWSDSEDDNEPQNDATCLMAIDSQEEAFKWMIDDEISNLVDLHMYMLCGGWKWQDL
ncbi:hypothetical protein Tco_1402513 [Tanacetum coccineum]